MVIIIMYVLQCPDYLTVEDGTDMLLRKFGNELPIYVA
jgi:hypothetical protein